MADNKHGDFIWYELMTGDLDGAEAFYTGLLGWTFEEASQGDVAYRTFSGTAGQVGGFLQLSDEMTQGGARPVWLGYVGVDSLDDMIEAFKSGGGKVMFGPGEVPGIGPFAMVTDPQGAPLYLIEDRSGEPSGAFAAYKPTVGHCAWNELMTADPGAAKGFFAKVFGWVVADTMDMGEMGAYDMLKAGEERDFVFGAVMKKPEQMPVSMWNYYFRVADIDVASAFVKEHGGQIINGPIEIPGGDFALSGIDPQGAMFSLVGARA
jgi:predicted enzyme related to lactoylglutathione lyase